MNAAATGINVQNFHIQDQEGKPPSIIPNKVLSPPPPTSSQSLDFVFFTHSPSISK